MKTLRTTTLVVRIAIGLLIGACALVVTPVFAGSLTNPGQSPYIKTGVYQGVVSIISGTSAMEIGNAGRDIAATGDIYLLPQGAVYPRGIRIKKSDRFAEAAIDVGSGRLCLNTDQAGAYTCVTAWTSGSGSDSLWNSSGGILTPVTQVPAIQTLRIGTSSQPVHGRALDLYGSYAGGATLDVNFAGIVFGDVYVDGQVRMYNGLSLTVDNPIWSGYNRFNRVTGFGTGIDADTFDGSAVLPFASDNNLFWKTQSTCKQGEHVNEACSYTAQCTAGAGSCNTSTRRCNSGSFSESGTCATDADCHYDCVTEAVAMCLNAQITAPNSGICTGGGNAGTQCTSSGQCQGGVCTTMCTVTPQLCPATSTTKHCTNNPAQVCTTSLDCGVGNGCIRGTVIQVSAGIGSSCPGVSCASVCKDRLPVCNGQGVGVCAGFGQTVSTNTGTTEDADLYLGGSCTPGVEISPGRNVWWQNCDCFLDTPITYYQSQPTGSGGLAALCTPKLR